jgi:SEL1 protein
VGPLTDAALSTSSTSATRRDALVALADIFFYGNNTVAASVNGTLAMRLYAKAADLGDAHAQFHLGVASSYGFWGFPKDDAQAMTQYYFAAVGHHTGAMLALGSRHLLGVNAPKSCETAVRYYEVAANKAMKLRDADVTKPAIHDLPHRRLKTVHESQHKKNVPSDAAIVDYYQFSSDKGDPEATMNLATLYYYGARGLQQDLPKAAALFERAHDLGATGSAYHLGHLYNYGIGVAQNNETALEFLEQAVKEGSTSAHNELAYMYLHGKGTPRDHEKALSLFKAAAKQGNMEAFYNLGVLHMQGAGSVKSVDPEYEVAHGYFQVAAHQGHTLSSHKLAHMSLHGIGTSRSCKNAVDSFKLVAERGEWDRLLSRAFKDFKNQDYEAAFMKYAVMAQQGYEVAQHNAAYLLEFGFLSPLFGTSLTMSESSLSNEEIASGAIQLYKLAALQGNIDANLKIGDFYYYGKGGHEVDFTKASAHYALASKKSNAQAMFNLGLMYEHGVGVVQDFHLAKRYFDKAIASHQDARVPATLALWKLRVHRIYQSWRRWYDELVGNIEPTTPASQAPPPSQSPTSNDQTEPGEFWIIQQLVRLENWLATPMDFTDPRLANWRQIVVSDDFLIAALSLSLGLVLYIRSMRQQQRELAAQPQPL